MNSSPDVVVIGGGMAGTAAALAAAAHNARVTLVRRSPGATALCRGGWQGPLHEALEARFRAADHTWHDSTEPLLSPDGALLRYERVAGAQHAVRSGAGTLVCGLAGLPGFNPRVLARMWSELAGADLQCDSLRLADTPAAGWSAAALAARISRDPAAFARSLKEAVQRARARAVILPAVLGLEPGDRVRTAVQAIVDVPVGEALGGSPSIPGWRLQTALNTMLERAGIDVMMGETAHATVQKRTITQVRVKTAQRDAALQAAAFVLATGKFVGGGIRANGKLREGALDCPVWIEHAGETFEQAEPLSLTNADRREEQPLLAAGVVVDAEGRPLDALGNRVYDNVWAAGAVRRGYAGPAQGLGHAAAEGWAAGERASAR